MSAPTDSAVKVSPSRRLQRVAALDVALAGALVLLTSTVAVGSWPVSVDHEVYRLLPVPTSPGFADVLGDLAQAVATLATPAATVGATIALAVGACARTRSTHPLRHVAPPVLAVSVLVLAGKAVVHRVGPGGDQPAGLLGYYPSGHTAAALVCGGALAGLVARTKPRWRSRLSVAVAAWTTLVATSMVFHRYHWLTDVLAAGLLGVLVLRACRRCRRAPGQPVR